MSEIVWITPSGNLKNLAEEEYTEIQLDAYDTSGSPLTYKVISGKLSSGLQLFKSGLIQGIPVVEQTTSDPIYVQTFTVRATNAKGNISDRTFSITVNTIALPQIIPKDRSLGSFYDGYTLDIDLLAIDPSPLATLTWKLMSGELPAGVTLSSSGKLSGTILPFTSAAAEALIGWSATGWDYIPWDTPTAAAQSKTYSFTVRVYDGTRFDTSNYTIEVKAKSLFTIDNTELHIDANGISVDVDNKHTPYITTQPSDLPYQRQDSNFAFLFEGNDLDEDPIKFGMEILGQIAFDQEHYAGMDIGFDYGPFDQEDQSFPNGISLDPDTGWLTGHLGSQPEVSKTYKFQIYCYKADYPDSRSKSITFTLTVLGAMDNTITWNSPAFLGTMENGSVSEFAIDAVSTKGKTLNYRFKPSERTPQNEYPADGVVTYYPQARNRIPQGLELLPNGLIIGRATFDYFSLDGGTTTVDNSATAFDNLYEFTITASDDPYFDIVDGDTTPVSSDADFDASPTVSDDKTFTIRINNINSRPYENIYLKALTSRQQRKQFKSLLANTSIFPADSIYRAEDPWFGLAKDIKFLFAAGMEPSLAATYIGQMANNHYTKRVNLGEVKTAVALDADFNVKYEVVYVEALDENKSVNMSINRSTEVQSKFNVMPFSTVYPNSLDNMKTELSAVGFSNRGAIPEWMLDQQEDGRVLGFTRGVVLAYTKPGKSKMIAYRIQQSEYDFNTIDFIIDRYQLDHHMSTHYDIAAKEFVPSKETTFDRLPVVGDLHPYVGAVDYALSVPFDEINNRSVDYINLNGGIDGGSVANGTLVIFAVQESYKNSTGSDLAYVRDPFDNNTFDSLTFNSTNTPRDYDKENDGWNFDKGMYGGVNYGVTDFSPAAVVPGYIDHLMVPDTINMRSGIWKVVVESNMVTLEFVQTVNINEYVQVSSGKYSGSKLYYDPVIKAGHSVPEYSILTDKVAPSSETTRFDGGGTRYYSDRDVYAAPETNDVYLKFPKNTVYG